MLPPASSPPSRNHERCDGAFAWVRSQMWSPSASVLSRSIAARAADGRVFASDIGFLLPGNGLPAASSRSLAPAGKKEIRSKLLICLKLASDNSSITAPDQEAI